MAVSEVQADPEALRIVRYSAGQLAPVAAEFTRRLHRDIVGLSPRIAVSMTDAGRPFSDRMARALIWVALTDQPLPVKVDVLGQVGADNWREGFDEAEYVHVAHALVRTIRDLSDSDWVNAMGSAWISCFMWMQPLLLAGSRRAAAEAAGAAQITGEPGAPARTQDDDGGQPPRLQ